MATDEMIVRAAIRDEMTGPLQDMRGELERFSREARYAGTQASTSSRGFDRMTGGVGRMAKMAGGAALMAVGGLATGLAVAGGAAVTMGVKTAASMETAKIGFTTMLGSARKANVFLRDLAKFAAKTPFEFPELQTAASSLISAGISAKQVIPIMTSLGNATSGMGTGAEGVQRATVALQQMNAAGKITAEDLNQLRDAGIPVYDLLAAATGKSKKEVAGLAASGKLGAKELSQLMKALESGKGLERFSGLMDKQSRSLSGLWSTAQDTLNMGLAKAMKPLIPLLKDALDVTSKLGAKVMPQLSKGLAEVIGWFTKGGKEGGHLSKIMGWVGDAIDRVTPLIQSIAGWIRDDLIPVLRKVAGDYLKGLRKAWDSISDALKRNKPELETFKGMLAAVGQFFVKHLLPALGTFYKDVLPFVGKAIGLVIDSFGKWIKIIKFLWNNVLEPILKLILHGMSMQLEMWSKFLGALSHVPGFGWAKDAADAMHDGAREANNMANALGKIPDHVNSVITIDYRRKHPAAAAHDTKLLGDPANYGAGDTATSKARGRGNLDATLRFHAATMAATGARAKISNALIGGGGRGRGSGDHQAGRALDLVGPGLAGYAAHVRAMGGYAAFHGSGAGRHLHAVPPAMGDTARSMVAAPKAPGGRTGTLTPANIDVRVEVTNPAANVDVRTAVRDAIREALRDAEERS